METSRLLGRGLVENCPDLGAMNGAQEQRFITGLIAGRSRYTQPAASNA